MSDIASTTSDITLLDIDGNPVAEGFEAEEIPSNPRSRHAPPYTYLRPQDDTDFLFSQFFDAATEAAMLAAFWLYHRSLHRADTTETFSIRDLLRVNELQFPIPSPISSTSSPRLPTRVEVVETDHFPTDHPGEGWMFNHPDARRSYPIYLQYQGRRTRAKYIRYRRQAAIPEIDGTMGRDKPVVTEPLRLPRRHTIIHPLLTAPQQRVFDPEMVTTLIIDHALEDLDDWPLRAEVDRYRYYTNDLAAKHRTLAQLRAEIRTTTGELHESVFRLSQANAYQRVKDRTHLEDDVSFFISNADLRQHFRDVDAAPYLTNAYCTWCQTESHESKYCPIFHVCTYCRKYGHEESRCYTPHKFCETRQCLVDRRHSRYNRSCRARPYVAAPSRPAARAMRQRRQSPPPADE